VAREIVAPGSDGLLAVVEAFGMEVLDATGALDRKALARRVFADEASRRTLNAITHPRIASRTLERTAALASAGEPLACYEAALLVENGIAEGFRPLVVCACSEEVQVARLGARDGVSEEEARARIRAQKPLAEKVAMADQVIDTGGSLADTADRTDEVLAWVCARAGVDLARYPAPR
jgi:dephospho-CoA kinase